MGLLDMLRRPRPIRNIHELSDFVDAQSAFLVQKGIYEYSRARAGHFSKVLLAESAFIAVVERSRWQAYPLGLAMVTEMVEGVLGRARGDQRAQALARLSALALAVFDRYPPPAALGATHWQDARSDLLHRLAGIGLHPAKPVKDIPEPYAQDYFALMPIHERLRGPDFPAMRSYLKVSLCNIHDELVRRIDADAVASTLHDDATSPP